MELRWSVDALDDYDRWQACRIALEEFVWKRGIVPAFTRISVTSSSSSSTCLSGN
jgi:hypothetical protein